MWVFNPFLSTFRVQSIRGILCASIFAAQKSISISVLRVQNGQLGVFSLDNKSHTSCFVFILIILFGF